MYEKYYKYFLSEKLYKNTRPKFEPIEPYTFFYKNKPYKNIRL